MEPKSRLHLRTRVKRQSRCFAKGIVLNYLQNDRRKVYGEIKVPAHSIMLEAFVRCTFDEWKSFTDIQAKYRKLSWEGCEDFMFFSFTIPWPAEKLDNVLEFAVWCRKSGRNSRSYWDNNDERNYLVRQNSSIISSNSESKEKRDILCDRKQLQRAAKSSDSKVDDEKIAACGMLMKKTPDMDKLLTQLGMVVLMVANHQILTATSIAMSSFYIAHQDAVCQMVKIHHFLSLMKNFALDKSGEDFKVVSSSN